MSPRTSQQLEKLRQERKSQIIEAALEVMASEGYAHTTMNQVAKASGISKGLIYNYFESKENLVEGILLYSLGELKRILGDIPETGLTVQKYIDLIDKTFAMYRDKQVFWRMYIAVMLQEEPKRIVLRMLKGQEEQYFRPWVDYYTQKGHPDPVGMTLFAHAVFDGIMLNHLNQPELFPLESLRPLVIQILV